MCLRVVDIQAVEKRDRKKGRASKIWLFKERACVFPLPAAFIPHVLQRDTSDTGVWSLTLDLVPTSVSRHANEHISVNREMWQHPITKRGSGGNRKEGHDMSVVSTQQGGEPVCCSRTAWCFHSQTCSRRNPSGFVGRRGGADKRLERPQLFSFHI